MKKTQKGIWITRGKNKIFIRPIRRLNMGICYFVSKKSSENWDINGKYWKSIGKSIAAQKINIWERDSSYDLSNLELSMLKGLKGIEEEHVVKDTKKSEEKPKEMPLIKVNNAILCLEA